MEPLHDSLPPIAIHRRISNPPSLHCITSTTHQEAARHAPAKIARNHHSLQPVAAPAQWHSHGHTMPAPTCRVRAWCRPNPVASVRWRISSPRRCKAACSATHGFCNVPEPVLKCTGCQTRFRWRPEFERLIFTHKPIRVSKSTTSRNHKTPHSPHLPGALLIYP
jgi:hypothetical protein